MGTVNRRIFTIKGYWQRVQRRRWIVIIPLLLSTVIAVFVALTTTPVYRATTILTAEEVIQRADVLSGISHLPIPAQERSAVIQQRLLSHKLLLQVAEALEIRDRLEKQTDVSIADTGDANIIKKG